VSASPDVIVVGAGIVGAACAWECAATGLSVTLLDAGIPGGGATAAGMGHIVVMDDSEAQFGLTRYSRRLWDVLAEELPAPAEYARTGTIWVAVDSDELEAVRKRQVYYGQRGVEAEFLDGRTLALAEPALARDLAGGLLVPGDAVVYPPAVVTFLIDRLGAAGGVVRAATEVVAVEADGVKLKDGRLLSAGSVVLATGQWAQRLAPLLPVRLRKGHLVITERYPDFVHHQLVELGYLKSAHDGAADSVAFNLQPRTTGQMLLGSSRQYDRDDLSVDDKITGRMIARATRYVPGIVHLKALRIWTGQRCATPDNLPLIGPLPGMERVFVATGHEGLGITTSLGTARLVAAAITGTDCELPPAPYSPSRFPELALARHH
jgi:glycine/D-amino acid oxidase-like deaminating enzyme